MSGDSGAARRTVRAVLAAYDATPEGARYDDEVHFTVEIPPDRAESFLADLQNSTSGQCRVEDAPFRE